MNPNRREFLKTSIGAVAALATGGLPLATITGVSIPVNTLEQSYLDYLEALKRYMVLSGEYILSVDDFCTKIVGVELTTKKSKDK